MNSFPQLFSAIKSNLEEKMFVNLFRNIFSAVILPRNGKQGNIQGYIFRCFHNHAHGLTFILPSSCYFLNRFILVVIFLILLCRSRSSCRFRCGLSRFCRLCGFWCFLLLSGLLEVRHSFSWRTERVWLHNSSLALQQNRTSL